MKHSYRINFYSDERDIEEKFESFNDYTPDDFCKEIVKYFNGSGDFTAYLYEDGKLEFVFTKDPKTKIEGFSKKEYGLCLYLHFREPCPFYCVVCGKSDNVINYGELQPPLTEVLDDLEFDPDKDFELRKYNSKDGSYEVIYRSSSKKKPFLRQLEWEKYPYRLELLSPTMKSKIAVNGRESEYEDMQNALVEYWIGTGCAGYICKDRHSIVDMLSATRKEER